MSIVTRGTAKIRHRETGFVYDIAPDELDWSAESSSERNMGPETFWAADINHKALGDLRWVLSEYPQGVFGEHSCDVNGHEVLQDFSVTVEHDPENPEEPDEGLQSLDREDAAEEMTAWFHENYEDPANSLPFDSREGGYQWVKGGPYTPAEVLEENFGNRYPWELIQEVGDSISDEDGLYDWTPVIGEDFDGGSSPLEATVEPMDEAASLSRRLPLAEELVQNPDSGFFEVRPKDITNLNLLGATLGQLADAIEDVLANQSNGLNAASLDIRKLRRTIERYANDPQRVEMDLTTVHGSLSVQIATGELPPSNENAALISALQEGAQGIRATDPEVAENRQILQEQALRDLASDDLNQIAEAAPVLEAITEGDLRGQMREDILFLTKEMREGPPRLPGVTREDAIIVGRDEAVRVLGRTARMLLILRRTPELVDKIHDSTGFRAAIIFTTLGTLITLGLLLF